MNEDEIEALTRRIGYELFQQARHHSAGLNQWWDRWIMGWLLHDPALKTRLFRFVDVLPALRSPGQITGHLREYLDRPADRLPRGLAWAVRWLDQGHDTPRARWIAWAANKGVQHMAGQFIAGHSPADSLQTLLHLRNRKMGFTMDLLGEAVVSETEADQYQQSYLDAIATLAAPLSASEAVAQVDQDAQGRPLPRLQLSIKLSSLHSRFDPLAPERSTEVVTRRLRPILRAARQQNAFVTVDMEQYALKDLTLSVFQSIFCEDEFRDWPHVGIAIQAYLKSCGRDLAQLADWAKQRGTSIQVRLVKGAYWDYETVIAAQNHWPIPVFSHKPDTDANYERQAAFLLSNRQWLRPAIASHNIRSIAHAMALARRMNIEPREIEYQMLYGMAESLKSVITDLGLRLRVYLPVGDLQRGMAYLVRRLLENTSNESFLRAGFLEGVPESELLMKPQTHRTAASQPSHKPLSSEAYPPFVNEPLTDFSQAPARAAMQQAIEQARLNLGHTYSLRIDGQAVTTTDWIDSINPSHQTQQVGRVARAGVKEAVKAVESADRAFASWRNTSTRHRADLLRRTADILRRRRHELAAWEVFETAKPAREADADVAEAIDYCEFYAREALRLNMPTCQNVPGELNETFYEPRGVAVVIAPWNFPLAILCGMTAAALATGNTAVMKPAEQSPVIAAQLMEAFDEAGFPPGVVNYLPGLGEDAGAALVAHRRTAIIAFTGSRAVGLSIASQASQVAPGQHHLKRVITEMGGKNAIIVDEDADPDEAIPGVIASAFGYAGQKCSACSRLILLDSIHDAFLNRLIDAAAGLRLAPADDPACDVPPVIELEAHQRITRTIERARSQAKLVYAMDPGPLASEGFYIGPHIFTDVDPESAPAQEEIFGPVLAVLRARDFDHALRIANGTPYALTGGLYSRSPARIAQARRQFHVGDLYINRRITGALVGRQPFGGLKLSGSGIPAGGADYLRQFLLTRTVTENTLRRGFADTQ